MNIEPLVFSGTTKNLRISECVTMGRKIVLFFFIVCKILKLHGLLWYINVQMHICTYVFPIGKYGKMVHTYVCDFVCVCIYNAVTESKVSFIEEFEYRYINIRLWA